MSTNSNFSNGQFFDGQGSSTSEGFTPLSDDQMDRMKGGFDLTETDDEPVDTDPEPVEEPIGGELGGEVTDG